jgi:N-acetylglutamate synthase-like GNAT family acetyltransferase
VKPKRIQRQERYEQLGEELRLMRIDKAQLCDVPAISKLFRKYIGDYEWHAEESLRNNLQRLYVVRKGYDIVAAVSVQPAEFKFYRREFERPNLHEITAIAVATEYRQQGIARQLLETALAGLQAQVICAAWADTGQPARLRNALEGNGFVLQAVISDGFDVHGSCEYCVGSGGCFGSCDNHLYLRSG